jgi:hypothetical protein
MGLSGLSGIGGNSGLVNNVAGGGLPVSGAVVWLAARLETGYVDNDSVGLLTDQTGNGHDAIQATPGYKPVFKTNILNAKPVIRFDGSDDTLSLGDLHLVVPNAATLFVVAKPNNDTSYVIYSTHSVADADIYWLFGSGYFGPFRTGRYDMWPAYIPHTDTHLFIVKSITGIGTYEVIVDHGSKGTQDATHSGGAVHAISPAFRPFTGDVAEIIMYDTVLSQAQTDSVEAYLSNIYKIFPGINTIAAPPVAGYTEWLAARALSGLNDNDPVYAWPDLSRQGMMMAQTDPAKQPIYKTGVVNSKPVIQFDGLSKYMQANGYVAGNSITMFLVLKPAVTNLVGLFDTAPNAANTLRNFSAGNVEWHGNLAEFPFGLINTNPVIVSMICSSAPSRQIIHRINGATVGTYGNAGAGTMVWQNPVLGAINLGGAGYYNGGLAEVLIYPSALSVGDTANVESYLNGIYNTY